MRRHGEYKMPGGKLVVADVVVADGVLSDVAISGDFFLEPDAALAAINASLRGIPTDAAESELAASVAAGLPDDTRMFGISAEAVAVAVRRAIDAMGVG